MKIRVLHTIRKKNEGTRIVEQCTDYSSAAMYCCTRLTLLIRDPRITYRDVRQTDVYAHPLRCVLLVLCTGVLPCGRWERIQNRSVYGVCWHS